MEVRLQGQIQRERIKCMGAYLQSVRTGAEEQARGNGRLHHVQK